MDITVGSCAAAPHVAEMLPLGVIALIVIPRTILIIYRRDWPAAALRLHTVCNV